MTKQAVIESVRTKVDRLLAEGRKLRSDLAAAGKANERLTTENRELRGQVATLQKRVGHLELQGGITAASGDEKAARARVNRLLREVDRCIALLS